MIIIVAIVSLAIGSLAVLSIFSKRPDDLGVTDGKLRRCPGTPNCVNSQSDAPPHAVRPIPFEGTAADARRQIRAALDKLPRTTIVRDDGDYIHAESRSLIVRFVDDVEIVIDADQKLIHIRSASRVGRSDLGVNRQRVETLRAEFAKLQPPSGGAST